MNTTSIGGVKITYFGHASVCFEFAGKNLYVDPFVLGRGARPADAILHTHAHHDHCAPAPSITNTNTVIIGKGCKHPGRPVEIGEKFSAAGANIEVVHAYNNTKSFHPKGFGCGYVLTFGASGAPAAHPSASAPPPSLASRSVRIYVAGDTDHISEMKSIRCDVVFLPIGGMYTMDVQEAAEAVADLKPKIVIPYHYNYLDETKADPQAFKRACEALVPGVDVRILTP